MNKIHKIVIDIVVSAIVFLLLAILIDLVTIMISGATVKADGTSIVNFNGDALLAIAFTLTIVFAVWFYKLLTNYKINKIKKE